MICIVIRKFRIISLEIFKCLIESTYPDSRCQSVEYTGC